MSVKTIFKVLIGTSVILVVSCLVVELFNLSVAGMQLKQACGMAANQAAELYTQETYKQKTIDGGYAAYSIAMPTVMANDGTPYVTGNFYPGNDTASIWNGLYANNSNFKQFCNLKAPVTVNSGSHTLKYTLEPTSLTTSSGISEFGTYGGTADGSIRYLYPYLNRLYMGVTSASMLSSNHYYIDPVTYEEFSTQATRMRAVTAAKSALNMKADMYTPVNIGVPYFDADTINKMFRWNLAQLLSNTMSENIRQDTDNPARTGQYYVAYKGFRCYVQDAYISELNYYVLDTSNANDAAMLQSMTGLTVKGVNAASGEGIRTFDANSMWTSNKDVSNRYITVVGIKYKIPMTYEGITPLKLVFEYGWNREVAGYDASVNGGENLNDWMHKDNTHLEYTYDTQSMSNDSGAGVLSTTGELYYVLVR